MSPSLSAELYQQGLISKSEALWYYSEDGKIAPNASALFDSEGQPNF